MNKLSYVKPVTEIQSQVYFETPLLAGSGSGSGSGSDSKGPGTMTNTLKDGLPTFGGAVDNPSLIKGLDASSSKLWDDEE